MYKLRQVLIHAVAIAASAFLLAAGHQVRAEGPPKQMVLQKVMKQLGHDMQEVTGAISKEEWARVAQLAPKIASHPQPSMSEKMRILKWLGKDAGEFRSFDGQAHEAATSMGNAAKRGDGKAVIDAFADVQKSCLGCHQGFRKSFKEHFYTRP